MDNLPTWAGASTAYSRAYRILCILSKTEVSIVRGVCFVSEEMRDFIKALDTGNEEGVKGYNLKYLPLLSSV